MLDAPIKTSLRYANGYLCPPIPPRPPPSCGFKQWAPSVVCLIISLLLNYSSSPQSAYSLPFQRQEQSTPLYHGRKERSGGSGGQEPGHLCCPRHRGRASGHGRPVAQSSGSPHADDCHRYAVAIHTMFDGRMLIRRCQTGGSIGAGLFVGTGPSFHHGGPGSVVSTKSILFGCAKC